MASSEFILSKVPFFDLFVENFLAKIKVISSPPATVLGYTENEPPEMKLK